MSDAREQYTMGYGPAATAMMASRTARRHAAFLVSHLKPGMKVLDCGCGPGSITLGLAEIVSPGEAVGTDLEESQLELGRAAAAKRQISNARFQVASAYELPFADESFDAVFISAVLGNLREPLRGLAEAYRILKPDGVIGVKEFDHGGDLLYPLESDLAAGLNLYYRLRRHYGHDPESGRKVRGLLEQAGFRNVNLTATYETYSGADVLPQFGRGYAALISEAFAEPLQRLGWVTPEVMHQIIRAWQEFPTKPGAFYALTWCEGLGWK
jgi:ubiquinone/menaquinone biosynthesis C-methylase UbiE